MNCLRPKKKFEKIMYWIRPLKTCKGRGCYVDTPARKDGVPYCLSCKAENNPIDKK